MPAINDHVSSSVTKLLLIGDSGAGKTGALASLAADGYKLRILDFDNGLDILRDYCSNPTSQYVKTNPKIAENVYYKTLIDPMKSFGGRIYPQRSIAWQGAMQMLDHWKDGEMDLGKVETWGSDTVLVIDSMSNLSTAAFNFHLQMNGALGAPRTQNEWRRDVGGAQALIRSLLQMLYDSSVKCNVIVTSHITFVTEGGGNPQSVENKDDSTPSTGYPSAIGRALSPQIPRFFNTVLLAKTIGAGAGTRHRIYTKSEGLIGAKNSAPLKVLREYPLETGLAEYFKAVRS